jgi:hypothetical protein
MIPSTIVPLSQSPCAGSPRGIVEVDDFHIQAKSGFRINEFARPCCESTRRCQLQSRWMNALRCEAHKCLLSLLGQLCRLLIVSNQFQNRDGGRLAIQVFWACVIHADKGVIKWEVWTRTHNQYLTTFRSAHIQYLKGKAVRCNIWTRGWSVITVSGWLNGISSLLYFIKSAAPDTEKIKKKQTCWSDILSIFEKKIVPESYLVVM